MPRANEHQGTQKVLLVNRKDAYDATILGRWKLDKNAKCKNLIREHILSNNVFLLSLD